MRVKIVKNLNFLAHIYLSGENDFLKIGNFIADTVRGKQYLEYPQAIQQGILLHRKIDSFTDQHPIFRMSKKRIFPIFGHYSGVIVDIYYDYFLAKNWHYFSDVSLSEYTNEFYKLLLQHQNLFNEKANLLISHMIKDNWLESYQTLKGIESIFFQMDKRTGFISKMKLATNVLQEDETTFEKEFFIFFKEIQLEMQK